MKLGPSFQAVVSMRGVSPSEHPESQCSVCGSLLFKSLGCGAADQKAVTGSGNLSNCDGRDEGNLDPVTPHLYQVYSRFSQIL